eukprot:gene9779-2105_t
MNEKATKLLKKLFDCPSSEIILKTRKVGLKTFKNTFLGVEVIKEVCVIYSASKEDAWKYIQLLFIKSKIFKNITLLKRFSSELDHIFQISNSVLTEIPEDFDLTKEQHKSLLNSIFTTKKSIQLKSRMINSKNYPNCFIGFEKNELTILGGELITLICDEMKIGRLSSIKLIQKYFIKYHLIVSCHEKTAFEDNQWFNFQNEMINLIHQQEIMKGNLTCFQEENRTDLFYILYSNGCFVSFSKKGEFFNSIKLDKNDSIEILKNDEFHIIAGGIPSISNIFIYKAEDNFDSWVKHISDFVNCKNSYL